MKSQKNKENAETANYSQNTQTDWECGDYANCVGYDTVPGTIFCNEKTWFSPARNSPLPHNKNSRGDAEPRRMFEKI